ncbi:histidine phosphatase superfamily [Mrakia frigida]|uniref:histidine phosphatase superfamily n=1 Tax=Mrakia frigida TaxID=29902 RepID=UPI003FCBFF3F
MAEITHKFEHVPGFFHQDDLAPLVSAERSLDKSFGLLDESPERWSNLKNKVAELNASAPEGTSYKVIYFARHGQGYHNVAEVKYSAEGTWENHWGKLKTDGALVWGPDPSLTSLGESQARNISQAWVKEKEHGVPLPSRWYTSPMRRTGNTCLLSWEGIFGGFGGEGKNVKVLENLREVCGMHWCDSRLPKSELKEQFPHFVYPPTEDMPEADEMFDELVHESPEHVQERVRHVLEHVWTETGKDEEYISLTSHCGYMRAAFIVVNHPPSPIVTGEMVPMVVRRVPLDATPLPSPSLL